MQKIDLKINKSKIYFTPLFNQFLPIRYFSLLKNTYFWHDSFYEETFCLLYKFDGKIRNTVKGRKGFTVYEENVLLSNKNFLEYIDYNQYVLYKFYLTDELLEMRDILIEGRYSKLPIDAKEKIIEFTSLVYGFNDSELLEKILYKDKDYMQDLADELGVKVGVLPEAASALNPDDELFINSLRENEDKKVSTTS